MVETVSVKEFNRDLKDTIQTRDEEYSYFIAHIVKKLLNANENHDSILENKIKEGLTKELANRWFWSADASLTDVADKMIKNGAFNEDSEFGEEFILDIMYNKVKERAKKDVRQVYGEVRYEKKRT